MQDQTQEERDTLVLLKVKKKSVLMVRLSTQEIGAMLKRPETLRLLVDLGLCLYHTCHMGGLLDVNIRIHVNIRIQCLKRH